MKYIEDVQCSSTGCRNKLYFGHPINTYGTALEAFLLGEIAKTFPLREVENPNQEKHAKGYEEWKKVHGNGMRYFLEEVLKDCSVGVFLPFRDGAWGAGVFAEAKELMKQRGADAIFAITSDGVITPERLVTVKALSIEETRVRIRDKEGLLVPF